MYEDSMLCCFVLPARSVRAMSNNSSTCWALGTLLDDVNSLTKCTRSATSGLCMCHETNANQIENYYLYFCPAFFTGANILPESESINLEWTLQLPTSSLIPAKKDSTASSQGPWSSSLRTAAASFMSGSTHTYTCDEHCCMYLFVVMRAPMTEKISQMIECQFGCRLIPSCWWAPCHLTNQRHTVLSYHVFLKLQFLPQTISARLRYGHLNSSNVFECRKEFCTHVCSREKGTRTYSL